MNLDAKREKILSGMMGVAVADAAALGLHWIYELRMWAVMHLNLSTRFERTTKGSRPILHIRGKKPVTIPTMGKAF